jgi:flavorubredoxin
MKPFKLSNDLFWLGALDPNLRVFDIIMKTEFGTTYNAYLLKGSQKTVLFETVKYQYVDEYLRNLSTLTAIDKIDYLVVNHTEPDHSGSIERLLELNPNLTIIGTASGIKFLTQIVNRDFKAIIVGDNDTLSLGNRTMRFFPLPNLHWPDTMFTYIEEDHTLVTCDAFGCHYCFDGILLSKITNQTDYQKALKFYFDMIIAPFRHPFVTNALKRIEGLPIGMILTGHGPVLDIDIKTIIDQYQKWSLDYSPFTKPSVVIAYVSAYGYTKALAMAIAKGVLASGDIDVRIHDMGEADAVNVLNEIAYCDGVLLGTPTMVGEALKPIWDLTSSMVASIHGKKPGGAFGSYGWSGEGVPHIIERLKQLNMKVDDGLRVRFKPTSADLDTAEKYGFNFGNQILNK